MMHDIPQMLYGESMSYSETHFSLRVSMPIIYPYSVLLVWKLYIHSSNVETWYASKLLLTVRGGYLDDHLLNSPEFICWQTELHWLWWTLWATLMKSTPLNKSCLSCCRLLQRTKTLGRIIWVHITFQLYNNRGLGNKGWHLLQIFFVFYQQAVYLVELFMLFLKTLRSLSLNTKPFKDSLRISSITLACQNIMFSPSILGLKKWIYALWICIFNCFQIHISHN